MAVFGTPEYQETKNAPVAESAPGGRPVFGPPDYQKNKEQSASDGPSAQPVDKPDWGDAVTYGIADSIPFAHDIGAAAQAAESYLPKSWQTDKVGDYGNYASGASFGDRYRGEKKNIENVAKSIYRDYPTASVAIPLVTGAAALPVGGAVGGVSRGLAGLSPRLGGLVGDSIASGAVGSGLGALYGAGTGDGVDERLNNAKSGAIFGGVAGSAAPAIGRAVSGVTSGVMQHLGIGSAEDKAAAALNAASNPATEISAPDVAKATANGQPLVMGDVLGGTEVQRLAENAMVESPKAEAIMKGPLQQRFEDAGERAKAFFQGAAGTKLDPAQFLDDLHAQGQVANKANYKAAFSDPKAQAIWNPELENLVQVDNVQKALADAGRVSQIEEAMERNQNIKLGLPVPNTPPIKNPFVIDPASKMLTLPTDPVTGKPTVTPDLRFWDIVKRNLDSQEQSALSPLGKATNNSRLIGHLRTALVDTLDREVSSYQPAREGAAGVFGEKDAYNAGLKFLGKKDALNTAQSLQDFNKLTPQQKDVFRKAVLASMAQNAENVNFRTNSLRQFNDPATAGKIKATLGPHAGDIEDYLKLESRMDEMRHAIGNSRTAVRQADHGPLGHGLLGAAASNFGEAGAGAMLGAGEAYYNHGWDPKAIAVDAAIGFGAGHALKSGSAHKRAIAEATARLLMESDPSKLQNIPQSFSQKPGMLNLFKSISPALPAARAGAAYGQQKNNEYSPPALAPAYAKGGAVKRKSHEELVSRLMSLSEKAKAATKRDTKSILNVPDNTVAKALEVAQKAI